MRRRVRGARGSTLVLALTTIALLAIMAAYTLRRVAPKFQMAAQSAGWQEARLAAETGVDLALRDLQQNAAGAAPGDWNGWKQNQGGIIGKVLSDTLSRANSLLSLLGSPVTISAPIFLDNVKVSPSGGTPTNVDMQLWAVYPTTSPYYRWFRIRAMATCPLPRPCYRAPDDLDVSLRRYSLRAVRPQLKKDDQGGASSVPPPSASRIVEVLVEPILPFELALMTSGSMSLATSGGWNVDSFDSRDPLKSNPDGTYPGKDSPLAQANGNIASDLGRPSELLYGPLISANGCKVQGAVATNGGDDPATAEHENVTGGAGIDPSRVRSDFFREMPPLTRPASGIFLVAPILGLPFVAGTETAPTQYLVSTNLHAFSVAGLPGGVKGAVVIMVNGDLDIPDGTITIDPNVTAVLYVRGNIDFHDRPINTGAESSRRAGQLQIYGEDSHGDQRTLRAFGNASICAAFYGPSYDISFQDNVEWFGAVAGHSFQMIGGGNGGFHYDEALGMTGPPISFRIARYIEDVRE